MTFGSLFAGIGGIDLGLERAGMVCRWQVEISEFCRKVLARHWPAVPKYGDITQLTGDELEQVDLICGGFPCQDISLQRNDKRLGMDGRRSGLWREYFRLVCVLRPRIILMENVAALLVPVDGFRPAPIARILGDLAGIGFDVEWQVLPAGAFGAYHERRRVFLLAYPSSVRRCGRFFEGQTERVEAPTEAEVWRNVSAPFVCRGADGVPDRAHRLHALGNAVHPNVAEWIGRRIMKLDMGRL